jgi:hypothetical protein
MLTTTTFAAAAGDQCEGINTPHFEVPGNNHAVGSTFAPGYGSVRLLNEN